MVPQIIYIIMVAFYLVMSGYQHEQPKEGYHNVWDNLIALALQLGLLYWGGFFDVLFK